MTPELRIAIYRGFGKTPALVRGGLIPGSGPGGTIEEALPPITHMKLKLKAINGLSGIRCMLHHGSLFDNLLIIC
jgi:hypothetical protein